MDDRVGSDDPFQVLLHLPGVHFHVQKGLSRAPQFRKGFAGKRVKSDGADQSDLQTFRAGRLHGIQGGAGRAAKGEHDELGPGDLHLFPTLFPLLDPAVFLRQLLVQEDEPRVVEGRGIDHLAGAVPLPAQGPGFFGNREGLYQIEIHGLHHLAEHAVHKNNDRVAIHVGQVKGKVGHLGHLLGGRRPQDDGVVIPVSSPLVTCR